MIEKMTCANAINLAFSDAMSQNEKVLCYGLGADDCKAVFGTLTGLQEKFGEDRVFDMPISENGMTGVAVGAALKGYHSVLTHQRLDFALLSMDQIVNNAAKWHFMFGGQASVPITIRCILGRGWGQGPTHSQNLQSWFAHIPGLKVVMPSTPDNAANLLVASILDPNPVIFLEHRWLHNMVGDVSLDPSKQIIGPANIITKGDDITVVSSSYMTVEAIHAVNYLNDHGISCEHIDLPSITPLDLDTITASVKKTGRLLALDTGFNRCSVANDIVAKITKSCWEELKSAPQSLTSPDMPEATSPALTENYHVRAENIVDVVSTILNHAVDSAPLKAKRTSPHDVPGDWFKGPF